jgi:hypothetical protein
MAKAYQLRPSRLLFPTITNVSFLLFVDNLVFSTGYTIEKEIELEEYKAEMKYDQDKFKTLIKVIAGTPRLF